MKAERSRETSVTGVTEVIDGIDKRHQVYRLTGRAADAVGWERYENTC